jgi:large subunit ribosomal protein L17
MKKRVFGKNFSRDTTSRRAMYRALVRSFVVNKKLVTTYTKAGVILPMLEGLFNRARVDTLKNRRYINSFLGNSREVSESLFKLSKIITNFEGGYLKKTVLPARKGDNASMARIEFKQKIVEAVSKPQTSKTQEVTGDTMKKTSVASVIKRLSGKSKKDKKI